MKRAIIIFFKSLFYSMPKRKDTFLFHRGERVGKGGLPITITKIRTMKRGAAEERGNLYPTTTSITQKFEIKSQDPRVINKFARFLRRTHIDEQHKKQLNTNQKINLAIL